MSRSDFTHLLDMEVMLARSTAVSSLSETPVGRAETDSPGLPQTLNLLFDVGGAVDTVRSEPDGDNSVRAASL
jgi:hypothetical protein